MSINIVKIKPKGINIEYHGSDTRYQWSVHNGMVLFNFFNLFFFAYFPLQKQGVE